MAFPEFSAGYTMEEMQGKTGQDDWAGTTIDSETVAPIRAAAAPAPRAARVYEAAPKSTPPERTDEQWRAWLDKLRAACAVLRRRDEVVEVANRPSVGDAIADGPPWVRSEISAILAENYARFGEEEEAIDPDTGEIRIKGEEKAEA